MQGVAGALAAIALVALSSACDAPFGLGQPTTRALENGAASTLTSASSLEIVGSYTESGDRVNIDLVLVKPDTVHLVVKAPTAQVEAILFANTAYFRGQAFLAQHMGNDPLSQNLIKAAGNAWWKGSVNFVPRLPDLVDGATFKTTFLGPAVTQRTDHASVDGVDAVDLSGPRADVYIASTPPYRVLLVHFKQGVAIDGLRDADLRFENFNHNFGVAPPKDVIDFSNLSTLPPIYTVVSVDTSRCTSPCVVSALVKNLGGLSGAKGPSTITFTMTAAASGTVIGTCQAPVTPDVGYNSTATVSCMISNTGTASNAAIVTASADNPGRG